MSRLEMVLYGLRMVLCLNHLPQNWFYLHHSARGVEEELLIEDNA
jgi:hypothetical protein